MLKTRLIPMLLLHEGRMVKGKQFCHFRDTGDPIYAARVYNAQYVDELIFLDIGASHENRSTLFHIIQEVAKECFMPFSVGGGISKIEDIHCLLKAGVDRVVICSAAVENPNLISQAVELFGSQCIIVCVDVKKENDQYCVYTHSGRNKANIDLLDHVKNIEKLGAGEVMINSIDCDGMMQGYDLDLLKLVRQQINLPMIAAGGAGTFMHLVDAIKEAHVDAVACASIFHFGDNNPIRARSYLKNQGINVKKVK